MNKIMWIFRDGFKIVECTSFPYAYRTMKQAFDDGIKEARNKLDMFKKFAIISPMKDAYGDKKVYTWFEATEMAKAQGLVNAEGQINGKEFKRRR
jgi:hypothetical protein